VRTPILATRRLAAPPEDVFEFLEDLGNHVTLAPGSAEVLSLQRGPHNLGHGVVRLTGPFGLRRTAWTELVRAVPPRLIAGRARIGHRTRASVTWRITSTSDGGSLVTLSTNVERSGLLDRLVLAAGGRAWIAKRFAAALEVLEAQLLATEYETRAELTAA
jgi:hypothetical protein